MTKKPAEAQEGFNLASVIYTLRGQLVMLDSDLAKLFGVPTKRVNEAVRRGKARFPEEFVFLVTGQELAVLRSQIATSRTWGGRRTRPYAVTEHGAIMLATVLNSPRAIEASIYIVKAFVRLRELLISHKDLGAKLQELERKVLAHDHDIQGILAAIRQLMTPPPAQPKCIGFSREQRQDHRRFSPKSDCIFRRDATLW